MTPRAKAKGVSGSAAKSSAFKIDSVDFESLDRSLISHQLSNGFRIAIFPQQHLRTASVTVLAKVGSRNENKSNNGISHFLEHILFRGNKKYKSPKQLNLAIESIGGSLNAATQTDLTTFQASFPHETLQQGLEVVASLWHDPVFSGIDIERKIIREEILEDFNEHGVQISPDNVAREQMFPNHPLGYPIAGVKENLRNFDRERLSEHFTKFHNASNMFLCIGGNCQPEQVLQHVQELFASLPTGKLSHPVPFRGRPCEAKCHFVLDEGNQTDLRLSFFTVGENAKQRAALLMLLRLLDDGMSTPLYRTISEEKGLAYEVFADVELFEECGVLDIGTTVENGKAVEMVGSLLALLQSFEEDFNEDNLIRAKRRYLWDMEAAFDDADEVSVLCGSRILFGLDPSLQKLAQAVLEVTLADLRDAAQQFLYRNPPQLVCVGDLEQKQQWAIEELIKQS